MARVIVDAHVHILPPRMRDTRAAIAAQERWFGLCHEGDRVIATVDDLLAMMEEEGIDRAVCFGWPFADPALCREANEHLAAAQRAHPDRVIACATVNPASDDAPDELRRCARLGLRGVGELNCDAQGFTLDDPAVEAAVRASVELELPWTLHCSEPVGHAYAGKGTTTPDKLARFIERHESLQLICAHLGGGLPFYAHMPEVAALCRRVWFDTAAAPFLYEPSAYGEVVARCGADRLLFGSDYPLLRAGRYRRAFGTAGIDESQLAQIVGGTAASLFRL